MKRLCTENELREKLKKNARGATKEKFGFETFTANVVDAVEETLKLK